MIQSASDALNSLHSDSIANELLEALTAKLSSVSGNRDKFLSISQTAKIRNSNKPTLEDITDRHVIRDLCRIFRRVSVF